MKREEAQTLEHGVYRVFWKESEKEGYSVAAIGSTHDGTRWIAPTNWVAGNPNNPCSESKYVWNMVSYVELIETQNGLPKARHSVSDDETESEIRRLIASISESYKRSFDQDIKPLMDELIKIERRKPPRPFIMPDGRMMCFVDLLKK